MIDSSQTAPDPFAQAHLLVLAPPSSQACVPLRDAGHALGRSRDASVYVDDPAIGWPGFQVRPSGKWLVVDNIPQGVEVVVHGRKVGPGALTVAPGEVVSVASCVFVVVTGLLPESVRAWGMASVAEPGGQNHLLGVEQSFLARVARSEANVLIHGESGSGKEVVSRFIHEASARRRAPFVAINAGALPGSLLEAELFGHVRGAFTGADRSRTGLIASAEGGTLLLDEIAELPLTSQAKILRLLDTREVLPVGSSRPERFDVRFLAATNRNLQEAVERGEFREDLYYRLAGFTVEVPPLRDRIHDIVPLAVRFLDQMPGNADRHLELSKDAQSLLLSHRWPGNVRELKNAIMRAALLAEPDGTLDTHHFPDLATSALGAALSNGSLDRRANERELIVRALKATAGNQTHAARELGMSRRTLVAKIRQYDLPRPRAGR